MKVPEKFTHEIEYVTPSRAEEFLLGQTRNRRISESWVKIMATAMAEERFRFTHQGMAFDVDGKMLDGQHRAMSIVESGVTLPFLVCRGLDKEAMLHIDVARRRSAADGLVIMGLADSNPKRVAAVLRSASGRNWGSFTGEMANDLYTRIGGSVDYVLGIPGASKVEVPILSVLARAHYAGIPGTELNRFVDVYRAEVTREGEEGAGLLRSYVLKNSLHGEPARRALIQKTERAIWAFLTRERIGVLKTSRERYFEVQQ